MMYVVSKLNEQIGLWSPITKPMTKEQAEENLRILQTYSPATYRIEDQ